MTGAVYPDLKRASVFITGGGSGIGASLTEGFLRQGAKVAFVQRSDASDFAVEMEEKTGNRPLFLKCDITDIARLKACIEEASLAHGPITVLVNNAANDRRHTTEEVDEAFWDWVRRHARNETDATPLETQLATLLGEFFAFWGAFDKE